MAHRTTAPQTVTRDEESPDSTEQLVRERAYELYEERGCEAGHELDDWLKAEAEILGKRTTDSARVDEIATMVAVAV
jgi:Protein of unknown function (DUF2934)